MPGCKGRLKDFILDWEDALPEDELVASEEAASTADLAICLGTSLQITPACDLPLRTPKAGELLRAVATANRQSLLSSALALQCRCSTDTRWRTLSSVLSQATSCHRRICCLSPSSTSASL